LGLILSAALLSSCVLKPPSTDTRESSRVSDSLHETNGRHVLNRAFKDFYDSAFVLTNDGKTAPRVVRPTELADTLAGFDVVFYGENHGHAGVHLQQMKLLRALYERDSHWVLSLEQFERDVQGVVDDYLAGRIGETTLIDKGRAWNNYASSYRPLLIFAKEHHLPVIAAEAPGWTITCVGQWGTGILDRFTPLERSWVAQDVHVVPGPYRDKYMQFLGGSPAHGEGVPAHGDSSPAHSGNSPAHGDSSAPHGGGAAERPEAAAKAERSFSAQVTRDDTMAESIERAVRQHPGYKVLHLTGSFHSEAFLGTVERLRMRDPRLRIAVIDPVAVDDPSAPGFTADSLSDGTVLQLIYPNPNAFVDGEDKSAAIAKMMHEHEANRCKYTPPTRSTTPAKPPRSQSTMVTSGLVL
jgi:uncharacterized iron-regulated protein